MVDKFGVGLFLIFPITTGQAHPADTQLARHPLRAELQLFIHHIVTGIFERFAIGNAGPRRIDRPNRVVDIPDGGFGWATRSDDLDRGLQSA